MTAITQTDIKSSMANRGQDDACFKYLSDKISEFDAESSASSSGPEDDDMNYFDYDDEQEFETIFATIGHQKQKSNDQNFKLTLRYLFKLLKFYKLEHYVNELIDNGYFSPLSLTKLTNKEFDMISVSPYDKKKFLKLQLFLKQVMNTIKMTCKKSSKISLNADPNLDFKMFTLNEWKHLTNQTPLTSKSIAKQTSNSNDQLKENNELNLNENKNSSTPIWTEINPKTNTEPGTPKEMKQSSKNSVTWTSTKSAVQRAKSTEPVNSARKNANPVFSKLSATATTQANSVTHPVQSSSARSASNYFGPKIHPIRKEISNVELISDKGYNYGVPQSLNTKNKGFIRKTPSSASIKLNENPNLQLNSTLVTNEIFVFARKRPKLPSEAEYQDSVLVENSDCDGNICVDEVKLAVDGTPVLRKNEFNFDKTFDSDCSNEEIFKNSILPFINLPFKNRLDFNCICFGQTGSGKTHTLFGNKQQNGLCELTAESLFSNNERLFCGFYEIYNGQLYDLINRNSKLVLREDASGQLNVVGLVEVEIKSIAQLRRTIEVSQSNRHIGSTSFNKASSRSHAVIQFKVPNAPSSHSSSGHVIMKNTNYMNVKSKVDSGLHSNNSNIGKPFRLLFIDLAGSERGIDAQNNLKDNRKEGAEINQSLLALKECIRCIDQYRAYAPFRQSKLTRVLRDCFIGTGNTILIATVSPTNDCTSCSLNTLQYANRVRQMALRNRKKHELASKSASTVCKSARRNSEQQKSKLPPHKNEEVKKKIENSNNIMAKIRSKSVALNNKKPIENINKVPKNTNEKKTFNYLIESVVKNSNSNNILRSKPLTKSFSSTKAKTSSLFHPSKINCSSTPIKSVIKNNSDFGPAEDMLFVHDTPIKGHKLKTMPKSSGQIAELADRYFEKTNTQERNMNDINQINCYSINPQNDYLNSKIYSNSEMREKEIRADWADEQKNDDDDDDESGVESDELNKSFETRKKMKNEQRINNIYRVSPTPEMNKAELTVNEEKLNLLRKKQREMLEAKKYLVTGDESFQNDFSDSNENSSLSFKKFSETSEHLKNALDSQNQLRTYIRNLESKLTNLRNEIKDAGSNSPEPVRKNSTDSTDSFKEEKMSSFNKDVYCEFLQKRRHLEKQQENLDNFNFRRNFKPNEAEDDLEKKFIESQMENFDNPPAEKYQQNDSTLLSENDAFEKSMYKGSSLFSKSYKSLETKFDSPFKKCEFSPIVQDKEKEPVATPRTQLLNPIPIRLSSSSSSFESSFSLKQALGKSEAENLSPRLKTVCSKIWRVPSTESEKYKNSAMVDNQQVEYQKTEQSEKVNTPDKTHLIKAHQNQLTDLIQACQREIHLMSMNDSKMDCKEYLNQMEQLLSKNANSIKDLQNQITQLKTEIN